MNSNENIEYQQIIQDREMRENLAKSDLQSNKNKEITNDNIVYRYDRRLQTENERYSMVEQASYLKLCYSNEEIIEKIRFNNTLNKKYENYMKLLPDDEYQPNVENKSTSRHRGWLIKSKVFINTSIFIKDMKTFTYNIEEDPITKEIVLNGYIEFKIQKTLSALKKHFPGCYISGRIISKKLINYLILKSDYTISGPIIHELDIRRKHNKENLRIEKVSQVIRLKQRIGIEITKLLEFIKETNDLEGLVKRLHFLKDLIDEDELDLNIISDSSSEDKLDSYSND